MTILRVAIGVNFRHTAHRRCSSTDSRRLIHPVARGTPRRERTAGELGRAVRTHFMSGKSSVAGLFVIRVMPVPSAAMR